MLTPHDGVTHVVKNLKKQSNGVLDPAVVSRTTRPMPSYTKSIGKGMSNSPQRALFRTPPSSSDVQFGFARRYLLQTISSSTPRLDIR
jgi:hypothetical protein